MFFCFVTVGLLHGDMNQVERNEIISAFKNKAMPVLVATDVAGNILCCYIIIYAISVFDWYLLC